MTMPTLLDHFQDLEDPRWDRYKLHRLDDLLFITICAVLGLAPLFIGIGEMTYRNDGEAPRR